MLSIACSPMSRPIADLVAQESTARDPIPDGNCRNDGNTRHADEGPGFPLVTARITMKPPDRPCSATETILTGMLRLTSISQLHFCDFELTNRPNENR